MSERQSSNKYKKGVKGTRESTRAHRVLFDFRPEMIWNTFIFSEHSGKPVYEAVINYPERATIADIHELHHIGGSSEMDAQYLAMDVSDIVREIQEENSAFIENIETEVKILSAHTPYTHIIGLIALSENDDTYLKFEQELQAHAGHEVINIHGKQITYTLTHKDGRYHLKPLFIGEVKHAGEQQVQEILAVQKAIRTYNANEEAAHLGESVRSIIEANAQRGQPRIQTNVFRAQGKAVPLITVSYASKAQQEMTEHVAREHLDYLK